MNKERRKLRFDDFDAVLAEVARLRTSGYEHAGHGKLSLGQITDHLAVYLEGAVHGFSKLFPRPMQFVLRMFALKNMLKHKQSNLRIPAPIAVAKDCEAADGIERLRRAIERFRNHEGEYHTHMVFGKLTRDQWKHQQLWHCEHHLSFLLPKEPVESPVGRSVLLTTTSQT